MTQLISPLDKSKLLLELNSRINNSMEVVNNPLADTRSNTKKQYDKGAHVAPYTVRDVVMLWKPYKLKGVSGCFQPKWDGPWTILKFHGNASCLILSCVDDKKNMNVHVNQLKLAAWVCTPPPPRWGQV